ncbi:MAG: disulfide bond formation protein B [Gammaproteobacteria bacterium]|nr:disulfide bond formation protein B [Gammaproteobacteria bacterium]
MSASRKVFLLILLLCVAMTATALTMEHVMGLQPCYLCITQRVFILLVAALALLAVVHDPGGGGHRVYSGLVGAAALGGSFFSGKQLWLQSLPEDQVPACGPPADYLFEVLDFSEALSMLLQGDGNCAEVQWTLLGISIPGWTLLGFVVLVIMALALWLDKLPPGLRN